MTRLINSELSAPLTRGLGPLPGKTEIEPTLPAGKPVTSQRGFIRERKTLFQEELASQRFDTLHLIAISSENRCWSLYQILHSLDRRGRKTCYDPQIMVFMKLSDHHTCSECCTNVVKCLQYYCYGNELHYLAE